MNPPLITTIIPTYKRPQSLALAIQSVLDQSFPHFRICIYDNASQDETRRVAEEWMKKDGRISYFCHEKNIGSNANFHFGLHRVETPFFSFLSDDDLLFPWFYNDALKGLENFPQAAFFGGATLFLDEKATPLSLGGVDRKEGYYAPATVLPNNNWTSFLFRTKEAQETDLHPQVFHLDGDFLIRMYCRYSFFLSHKPCALFRQHAQGLSSQCSPEELQGHYQKMQAVLKEDPFVTENIQKELALFLKNSLLQHLLSKIIKSLEEKKFSEAIHEGSLLETIAQEKQKSVLAKLTIKLCQKSSLIHQTCCSLINFLRYLKKRKKLSLSEEMLLFLRNLNSSEKTERF